MIAAATRVAWIAVALSACGRPTSSTTDPAGSPDAAAIEHPGGFVFRIEGMKRVNGML